MKKCSLQYDRPLCNYFTYNFTLLCQLVDIITAIVIIIMILTFL